MSKEKMCFPQYKEEMKLRGSWSCVFANGEIGQITQAVESNCSKVFSR